MTLNNLNKYIKSYFFYLLLGLLIIPLGTQAFDHSYVRGKILLQVEENGEAWYVYPNNGHRYYLGRPHDAFEIMKKLSLGASHDFLEQSKFPTRLAGMILLDVESYGEAYYIHPETLRKHYLSRPSDAFSLMREFGLGATNKTLEYIPVGDLKLTTDFTRKSSLIQNVPFTTQAPYANWSDQRQQDGCEEASALMTVKWAREESLSKDEALAEILGASDYILDKYGEYRDVSLIDTLNWIYKDYFNYHKVSIRYNVSVDDIISELGNGNLIISPMDGQIMGNPYFTPPGPPRHMIVIRGYNKEKNTFITNDPGTRFGENYEYNVETLYGAIRDYPTGYHEKIEKIEKNIIVIEK